MLITIELVSYLEGKLLVNSNLVPDEMLALIEVPGLPVKPAYLIPSLTGRGKAFKVSTRGLDSLGSSLFLQNSW